MLRALSLSSLVLLLAACGSDESATTEADAPASLAETAEAIEPRPSASVEAPDASPSTPPAARSGAGATVVDRVAEAGTLTTLARLLRESGVADDLAAEGPFTLFAPSDEAFAEAGDLPTDPEAVRDLLLSHALPFRITAIDMDIEQTVETLGGARVTLLPGSTPVLTSSASRAQVVTPNLDARNGVVHVIDAVLL